MDLMEFNGILMGFLSWGWMGFNVIFFWVSWDFFMDFMGVQPGENGDEIGFILWFWLIVYELEVMAI